MWDIESNILDPTHAALPHLVWDNPIYPKPKLKPHLKSWIREKVYQTLQDAGYTNVEDWLSLYLTGSLTTYQYSDDSDVDVSLFVNSDKFPDWSRAEMIGLMVDKLDGTKLPGTPYRLQVFVVAPDIKPKDLYRDDLRAGYNIDNGTWVSPPSRERTHNVQIELNGFYSYALQQADKMERLLRYEPEKAYRFYHQIHNRRKHDEQAGKGDNAESNIIFKLLAQRGLLPPDVEYDEGT